MASIQDFPDEIILKVIKYLDINELVKFGEVSKRMRGIGSDQTLWQKMNISKVEPGTEWGYNIDVPSSLVPCDFLKMVLGNGCQYLSLYYMKIEGNLILDKASSLRYLDLEYCKADSLTFEEILASCHSLQKLSMASTIGERKWITAKMIGSICYQNGLTLQTLNLSSCSGLDLESIQKITENCVGLKNVDLSETGLSNDSINFLVQNLTPEVENVGLGHLLNLKDEHVKALVARCNKLSVLDLKHTKITDISLTHIIVNLQHTLKKLDIHIGDGITYPKVTELKSMEKLMVLSLGQMWFYFGYHDQENLEKLMPLVRLDESICVVERELLPADGIWDVEAKQIEYFKKFAKFQFEKLPIKAMLRIATFLERKDLLKVGQVSKKMKCIIQNRMIQNRH